MNWNFIVVDWPRIMLMMRFWILYLLKFYSTFPSINLPSSPDFESLESSRYRSKPKGRETEVIA